MSSTSVSGGRGRKRSRSASAIVADTACGHHILTIDGYSRTKVVPTGAYLKSGPFTIGGHRWHIDYHPNGHDPDTKDYISLFLVLEEPASGSTAKGVKAQQRFRFVGEVPEEEELPAVLLAAEEVSNYGSHRGWGDARFVRREDFEKSEHLKNDSFAVRCDIVVAINEFRGEDVTAAFVSVPPPDLHRHLGELLQTGQGADVVFEAGGETFPAHRCVLAARSPVFAAEFFGAMEESKSGSAVHIHDMEARVFKALLHFIYTDLFWKTNEVEEEEEDDVMAQHLLVAADRYNLPRLKLICEDKLCKYIDVGTVATILALAEQHHCHGLKKACFRFLSSPENLKVAVASESFDHLSKNCPSVMKELVAMLGTLLE